MFCMSLWRQSIYYGVFVNGFRPMCSAVKVSIWNVFYITLRCFYFIQNLIWNLFFEGGGTIWFELYTPPIIFLSVLDEIWLFIDRSDFLVFLWLHFVNAQQCGHYFVMQLLNKCVLRGWGHNLHAIVHVLYNHIFFLTIYTLTMILLLVSWLYIIIIFFKYLRSFR